MGTMNYKGIPEYAVNGLCKCVAEIIKGMKKQGKQKILDVGAGCGAFSQRMKDLGQDVIAIDLNRENFYPKDIPFYKINLNLEDDLKIFKDKFESNFDIIIAMEIIEHLESPWLFVSYMRTLIKDDGYILITTPNILSPLNRIFYFIKGEFLGFSFSTGMTLGGHINPIAETELNVILVRNGFILKSRYHAGKYDGLLKGKMRLLKIVSSIFKPFMKNTTSNCVCSIYLYKKKKGKNIQVKNKNWFDVRHNEINKQCILDDKDQ